MSGGYDDDYDEGADDFGQEPSSGEAAAGASRVLVPGIFMIITGVVNLGIGVLLCITGVGMSSVPDAQLQEALDQQPQQNRAQMEQLGWGVAELKKIYLFGCGGGGLVAAVCSLLTIAGGACMCARRARGFAFFAVLVTVLPCVNSPCIPLGLGVGIWSLIVLSQPDVKAAFR